MSDAPSQRYINREYSLLQFNRRVLEMAQDENTPLLERLRFLCISFSNMDEFFEVRLASLYEMLNDGNVRTQPDGLTPREAIDMLTDEAHRLVNDQYDTFNHILIPELAQEGIRFLRRPNWTDEERRWVRQYFTERMLPVLNPIGLDPAHPFPRVQNKALHFIVSLEGEDAFGRRIPMAVVQVPRTLPRVVRLPKEVSGGDNDFVFISSILHANVSMLFPGMTVTGCYQFRVTRNTNLFIDEEEVDDLMKALAGELSGRQYGDAIRLEVADNCPPHLVDFLLERFGLTERELYQVHGPVNLHRLMSVPDMVERPDLKFPPFQPTLPLEGVKRGKRFQLFGGKKAPRDIFESIRQRDILLHHPYEAFLPVVRFVREAARDPKVLAIRMTLYRTGEDSPIVDALEQAARAGKEVTAVVELRARFDEDNNIQQARRLQEAGAHVVYGVVGYKTHAKMIHVVREENGRLVQYAHLGTGNYHHVTSRFYTDFGLLTAHEGICRDVGRIFLQLTSLGRAPELDYLLQAPFTLHSGLLERIRREADNARAGHPARIVAKMNGLQEKAIIDALYEASQAGVEIDLIVRGICCLRPGVPGLSENIRVRSIVGRFLEHHRVFYFENHGERPELFISSADWMRRNLLGRVETACPILDPDHFQRVYTEGLALYLRDNQGAWTLGPDGRYERLRPAEGEDPFSAQQYLIDQYNTAES
ncbi:polyphosphate kinase 1 [Sulfurivirga sp.]|uniref:polyphosphate kinase 1 n=1 Tax=Sulfurivirga sp. TaxID=2614236 RepID=UPI0025D9E50E|nr:polyphosphate kinase 1 [Sulfurivirga sp.]